MDALSAVFVDGVTLAFFHSYGASTKLHDFSKIMESSLTMMSAQVSQHAQMDNIRDHWFVGSNPAIVYIHTLHSLMVSLCLHQLGFLFPRSAAQQHWVKTEVKTVLSTSAFSAFFETRSPLLFISGPIFHFCFCLLFTWRNLFCIIWHLWPISIWAELLLF